MRTGPSRLVVDTYAWIEYFLGTRRGGIVKEHLLAYREAYTPSIVLAEIARKYHREDYNPGGPAADYTLSLQLTRLTTIDNGNQPLLAWYTSRMFERDV